jgi:hypothetical protein
VHPDGRPPGVPLSRSIPLVIPGDPAALSPNARLHPAARRQLVRDWKAKTWDAWEKAGRPRLTPPVAICFLVRRARKMDQDNCANSLALKGMLDVLTDRHCPYEQSGQMLPDDGPDQVPFISVGQQVGPEWKGREEVLMIVEEIE